MFNPITHKEEITHWGIWKSLFGVLNTCQLFYWKLNDNSATMAGVQFWRAGVHTAANPHIISICWLILPHKYSVASLAQVAALHCLGLDSVGTWVYWLLLTRPHSSWSCRRRTLLRIMPVSESLRRNKKLSTRGSSHLKSPDDKSGNMNQEVWICWFCSKVVFLRNNTVRVSWWIT